MTGNIMTKNVDIMTKADILAELVDAYDAVHEAYKKVIGANAAVGDWKLDPEAVPLPWWLTGAAVHQAAALDAQMHSLVMWAHAKFRDPEKSS